MVRSGILGRGVMRVVACCSGRRGHDVLVRCWSGSQAHAGAEYFATSSLRRREHCFGPGARQLTWVRALGYQWAACSNAYLNGFVTNWACAPAGTWTNSYFDGSRNMVGVVHNNSNSNQNQL